jgi:hypothetical protein
MRVILNNSQAKMQERIVMLESKQAGGWVWLQWVLANTVGTATSFAVGLGLATLHETLYGSPTLYPHYTPARESGALIGAVFVVVGVAAYAVPGAMQWLVLRRLLPRVGWWVLTSALGFFGFIVAGATIFAISWGVAGRIAGVGGVAAVELGAPIGVIVGTAAGGAVLGAMQWLVLRRRVSRAGWWVVTTMPAMFVGVVALWWASRGFDTDIAAAGALGGALYGAITGVVLV